MNPQTEKELWQLVLDNRVKRFAKLVALRAPSYVLASDLMLLVKAVAGLYPEAYGQVVGESMQKAARLSMSRCVFCGAANERSNDENWCEACEASARAECEADDLAEAAGGDRPHE